MAKSPRKKTIVATTQPLTPFLFREVNPDWQGLFSALLGLKDFDPATPSSALPKLGPALAALFKLEPRSLEEEVYLLVRQALAGSIATVIAAAIKGYKSQYTQSQWQRITQEQAKALDRFIDEHPIAITSDFFKYPQQTAVVMVVARQLVTCLKFMGLPPDFAETEVVAFPGIFCRELQKCLEVTPSKFPKLQAQYQPNFQPLVEEEQSWLDYHFKLSLRANPEVLDLGVSLDQVHIRLRAYTESRTATAGNEPQQQPKLKRTIGYLDEMAEHWMEDCRDALMVLSGGPGSGKSSFARRFAAWRAWTAPAVWRVVYIPLHRFDPQRDLESTIQEFIQCELKRDTLTNLFVPTNTQRVLLVFDGLDELAQQGAGGKIVAGDFYDQLGGFLKDVNRDDIPVRVKALVCGRPVAVWETRAENRHPESVRHLLPYLLDEFDAEGRYNYEWHGQPELTKIDQRKTWWENYATACTEPVSEERLQEILNGPLSALSREPVLNALVARCLRTPDRAIAADTNQATVYEWLLQDILNRVHDGSGRQHLANLTTEDIARLLEEVALSAWHAGEVRATTKSIVRKRCEEAGLQHLLDQAFPTHGPALSAPLFLSFYIQSTATSIGQEPAFEFSHKSYGEYLVARGIKRFIETNFQATNLSPKELLKRWAEFFGPAPLTKEIKHFVVCLAELEADETRTRWRQFCCRLLTQVVLLDFPMEEFRSLTFREMSLQRDHAVAALFIIHSACWSPRCSTMALDLDVSLRQSTFPRLLQGLLGHATRVDRHLISRSLQGADLSQVNLFHSNFTQANLNEANLSQVTFSCADLTQADLTHADLTEANLIHANLTDANLTEANLTEANLTEANLTEANLTEANLTKANLTDAMISQAQLAGTIGDPAIMPDGKPPKKNWRTTKPRKSTTKSKKPATASALERPGTSD